MPAHSSKVFPQLYADPFNTKLGFSKSLESNQYIVQIGQSIYLLQYVPSGVEEQQNSEGIFFAFTGYSWTLLSQRGSKFPVFAVDYLFAGSVDFRYRRRFQCRLKFTHISAHLGDEFFADENVRPRVYSREFISGYGAVNLNHMMFYGALHWIYHTIPQVEPINIQFGTTIYFREFFRNNLSPYISADVQLIGEFGYHADQNIQLGIRFFHQQQRAFRFALTYQTRHKIFGQFFTETEEVISFGFFVDN